MALDNGGEEYGAAAYFGLDGIFIDGGLFRDFNGYLEQRGIIEKTGPRGGGI